MIVVLAVALAGAAEPVPPPLPVTPAPVEVQVDGAPWVALHPDLYRWRLARSVYADQVSAEAERYRGLVEATELDLDACRIRLGAEEAVSAAWRQRVDEWQAYADRVERRERRQLWRDALLVGAGAGLVVGGAWVATLAP